MFDTHVHSQFSCDARATMEAHVARALHLGLRGLAFTDHVEWYPDDEAYNFFNPAAYFEALDAARRRLDGQLTLLAGLELGNPQYFLEEASALLQAWPWDFVLASAHRVGNEPMWFPEFFNHTGTEVAYRRYFAELLDLVRRSDFDILAHLDLVRRDDWDQNRHLLPLEPFADEIRAILRVLVERGKGLEINTSGLAKGMGTPLPELEVLGWYRELGGEILVFGSDAHAPEHLSRHFETARDLALAAGFTRLARFQQRHIVDWIEL